jgi:DNA helicase II / ATP-dependent DNA helicase PcrA
VIDLELNEQQLQAAENLNGISVVIAVPGSGKTTTMTRRIWNLVNAGIAPENILGLTFTRNAAEAMRKKLKPVLEDKAERVHLSTIHSWCHFLLRNEGKIFEILDGKEQIVFIRKLFQKLGIKDISVGMTLQEIRLAKNNLISVDEFFELYEDDRTMTKVSAVYRAYEEAKPKKLLLDFEDLLLESFQLLSTDEEVRTKYQSMFFHLMVDEYQDCSPLQFELIRLLVPSTDHENSSLWVCGDDWQSIYAFTGASVGNILNFTRFFPGSRQFILNMNYRSTPQILRACQNLIRNNQRKIEKELTTLNPDGDEPVVLEAATEDEEAILVATEIQDLVERRGYRLEDIAVLYRANFQSRVLEETFSRLKIPYQIQNGLGFYSRREVAWLLDYLKLIHNPLSDVGDEALRNVINIPNRYVSRKFVKELERYASSKGLHLFEALATIPIEGSFIRKNLYEWRSFLDPLIEASGSLGPCEAIRILRASLDYDRFITDEDIPNPDDQKVQNLNQLQLAAARFDTIKSFLDYVETFQDGTSNTKEGVQLMTIHKAKGLEFPVVFVVGLLENILPSKRGDIEEERRICFVAISRAMKLLYLTYSHTYLGQPNKRSIFIDEILSRE